MNIKFYFCRQVNYTEFKDNDGWIDPPASKTYSGLFSMPDEDEMGAAIENAQNQFDIPQLRKVDRGAKGGDQAASELELKFGRRPEGFTIDDMLKQRKSETNQSGPGLALPTLRKASSKEPSESSKKDDENVPEFLKAKKATSLMSIEEKLKKQKESKDNGGDVPEFLEKFTLRKSVIVEGSSISRHSLEPKSPDELFGTTKFKFPARKDVVKKPPPPPLFAILLKGVPTTLTIEKLKDYLIDFMGWELKVMEEEGTFPHLSLISFRQTTD